MTPTPFATLTTTGKVFTLELTPEGKQLSPGTYSLTLTPVPNNTEELELLCAEAYQVVGSLLLDVGAFDSEPAQKILDNLAQARRVHTDVLPWPTFAQPIPNPAQIALNKEKAP